MAVFKVDIQTNYYGTFITNSYHVEAANLLTASNNGVAIANIQKTLIPSSVVIDTIRASTDALGDEVFYTRAVVIPGTRSGGGDALPTFCRWRVDMSIGFRRPLRKFLLEPTETDTTGGGFSNAALAFIQTAYCDPLVALGYVCGPDGTVINSAACNQRVGMRQLRRGSRRRTTPII